MAHQSTCVSACILCMVTMSIVMLFVISVLDVGLVIVGVFCYVQKELSWCTSRGASIALIVVGLLYWPCMILLIRTFLIKVYGLNVASHFEFVPKVCLNAIDLTVSALNDLSRQWIASIRL